MASSRPAPSTRPPLLPLPSRVDPLASISVFRRTGQVVHRDGMHAHRFYSFLYVDGGRGIMRVPGEDFGLRPGQVHLVGPGTPHDPGGLVGVTGWVIEFTAEALGEPGGPGFFGTHLGRPRWEGLLRGQKASLRRVTIPAGAPRNRFIARLEQLQSEVNRRPVGYQEAARAHLRLVLLDVLRLVLPDALAAGISPLVEEALAVIGTRYPEPLSLREVARAIGRSPSYVTHLVGAETGLTVLEWITERRLEEARRRLSETDEEVGIIGERCGFGSTNHFIRQFRLVHGMTPGAWRRSVRPRPPVSDR